ncbi:allophanate hydrolase [Achromobacter sp. GG226]|uniref:allophanate hydrolase n=1 Tax=Verticiella alkaliphila TaxID=2779529 RepID=UPI001C0D9F02|nr:allophanate hydrolase [Verticiella sp. GG226]
MLHLSTSSGPSLAAWRDAYAAGAEPARLLAPFLEIDPGDVAWIARLDRERLDRQLAALAERRAAVGGDLSRLPLYGVPFAVKDNIDVAGWPTTAACPGFAYVAEADAGIVARLRAAGAIVVGKTNLDQFATGLVGVRSPYGAVPNTFDPAYVSGGSSSGSASAVARGLVPFSLGTDTAGSGRVPAAFNNIVGLKPTKGRFSTAGVVPACRTLDCVSIFALTVDDAARVARVASGTDAADPYSRACPPDAPVAPSPALRLAVPAQCEFFGDAQAQAAFERARHAWIDLGADVVEIDFAPFAELAALLYEGPWVAERLAAVAEQLARDPDSLHPVVRRIVEGATAYSAVDTFRAEYARAALAARIQAALAGVDALMVPSTPSIYTIAEVEADPVRLNARLGIYTNFTNLADLCALALPAGFRDDGLPVGITLIAPAWHDEAIAAIGQRWQAAQALPLGATGAAFPSQADSLLPAPPAPGVVRVAVVGAHLTGMPLNHQLTSRGAAFVERTRTAADYRLYALANTAPPKPGLVRGDSGQPIVVELWDIAESAFGGFVAEIPAPLGIGTLTLEDGREVKGFICEPRGLTGARDITEFGGWRAFLENLGATRPAGKE